MKRSAVWITLSGLIAGLLLSSALPGGRSNNISKVHAQGSRGCSIATLNGTYGFFRMGVVPAGPLAAVGIAAFDGHGFSTALQTTRRNGVTTSDLFTTPAAPGTYEVDPDCAGGGFSPDGSVFVHFVIVDGGNEIFILSLTDANSVYGVMRRIDRGDR